MLQLYLGYHKALVLVKVTLLSDQPSMEDEAACSVLVFYVNGRKVVDPSPDPEATLLTYLRTKLRLTGSKLGCGEGGCGACTVMVSRYRLATDSVLHYSVNACLAPVCSLHGLAVTTVEGIGDLQNIHPVQERIAKFHGSQCGFCTPGMVMSMYTLLRNNPTPGEAEMEEYFDGNLCRCTGYRPILDGFRTLTKEFQCQMGDNCCKNGGPGVDDGQSLTPPAKDLKPYNPGQEPIFPPELKLKHKEYSGKTVTFRNARCTWTQPCSLKELVDIKATHPGVKVVVGNTEIGIEMKFKNLQYPVLVNPAAIPEMTSVEVTDAGVKVGGAVTLTQFGDELQALIATLPEHKTRSFVAMVEMLKWFASHQIRNVASVCGNIMTASPISDLNPLLLAAGATLTVMSRDRGVRQVPMDKNFFQGYRKTAVDGDELLVAVTVPYTSLREYFHGFKQATRREDDISLVNAGLRVELDEDHVVQVMTLTFGGMGVTTLMAHKTVEGLIGRKWTDDILNPAFDLLTLDLPLPPGSPGGVSEYRRTLALSAFFKFFLQVKQQLGRALLPSEQSALSGLEIHNKSSMQVYGGTDSREQQHDSVGKPLRHRAALQQATGEALFVDDLPETADELHMCLVTSSKAHANILSVDASAALRAPGVVDYISAKDVQGRNNLAIFMDTVFAEKEVTSFGQVIGGIVADTQQRAREAVRMVKIQYEELGNIITIKDAIKHDSYFGNPINIVLGDVKKGFSQSEHELEGEAYMNGQNHFYMETNACRVVPGEAGELEVVCSTQGPSDVQRSLAGVLGVDNNKITVRTKRLGGGFGGKETQSVLSAAPAAVAAVKLKRTVRCVLDRDDDMVITGNRHPFLGQYKVGFSQDGAITALDLKMFCNGGNSLDLSRAAIERAVMDITIKYRPSHLHLTARICRTHTTSNTAFRGFGAPQGTFISECIMDDIAATLELELRKVQERNFYLPGELTHYRVDAGGASVRRCWDLVLDRSSYHRRRGDVDQYNRDHQWKKKGIALYPLSFGISFMQAHMNQAGALVHIYRDGSVLVSHGGVEMGQGLHTKLIQVASEVLHVTHGRIHISETTTTTVPNTSATAASVSTDLNGMAVKSACEELMSRLAPFKKHKPDASWDQWVMAAYMGRVSLSATGFYATPNIGYNIDTNEGRPYHYNTYGAACSEVQIDCLTGDHKVLRTDIVMDIGQSINPAIDVGQIEGAFVQGYGLFMMEDVKVTPTGVHLTRGPGNYKIPAFGDIPGQFNVYIAPDSPRTETVFSSRGLNEPPLNTAMSVFLAVKDAIRAARRDNAHSARFPLLSPAVPARVRMACKDDITAKIPEADPSFYTPWTVDL